MVFGPSAGLALTPEEQKRVVEGVLQTHQVIADDLRRNVERLQSLCKAPSARRDNKSIEAIPKAQLDALSRRISAQLGSNKGIAEVSDAMRVRHQRELTTSCKNVSLDSDKGLCEASKRALARANEITQRGQRWQTLQLERLRLIEEVGKLQMRGCTRKGFYERLLAADSELVASGADGGLALFEELTGSKATAARPPDAPPQGGGLRELFERLFPAAGTGSTRGTTPP